MQTVLVAYRNEVFARGVMSFLESSPEVKVIGVSSRTSAVLEDVRAASPDVIIWERGPHDEDGQLLGFLQSPPCRVVTLSLDSVTATVHEAREVQMAGSSWLLSLIRGGTKLQSRTIN
jgi:DNA-binding NarL/FixJ family response regulator